MVSKLKTYFFNRDLESFKQIGIPKPTKRNRSLLFVLDASKADFRKEESEIQRHFQDIPCRKYFLVYDPNGHVESKSNIHTYNKKNLSWRKSILKPQEISLLKQAHHLVIFSNKKFKKDFEFIARAVSSNLNIGYHENIDHYKLDIAIDQKEENLSTFLQELKNLIPDLLKREGKMIKQTSELDVSL